MLLFIAEMSERPVLAESCHRILGTFGYFSRGWALVVQIPCATRLILHVCDTHSRCAFKEIYRMKALHLIVLVIVVGAFFLVVRGLFSAWALLELAWSAIFSLLNRF